MPIVQEPRVVVTGGGSGLGRAFAKRFATMRAKVLIADINDAGAVETKSIVEREGGKAWAVKCDVSKAEEVERLATLAREHMGGADVVINNAGVAVAGPVGEIPLSDWEWITGVNLWGVIYGCHFFAPGFKKQGRGHFINVASLAAIAQAPNMGPYNVTKAAVVALSETLAAELKPHGVGVTVVCPSFFDPNLMATSRSHTIDASRIATKLMKKSKVQADDVAAVAVEAAQKNKLYALPHLEGKVVWAVKRAIPQLFHGTIVARSAKRTMG